MQTIVASSGGQAHERAVKYVLENGTTRTTEDGELTLEAPAVAITVRTPLASPRSSRLNPVGGKMVEAYARDLLEGTDAAFEYDYHGRLFHYGPRLDCAIDQVTYMVEKLMDEPTTRRAVAVTWEPGVDTGVRDVPCLQWVKCLAWDGRLNMAVVFRSNDFCTALGANIVALIGLQHSIADRVGLEVGEYEHVAFSPHVYLRRDADYLRAFCEGSMEAVRPPAALCAVCRAATCPKCPTRAHI